MVVWAVVIAVGLVVLAFVQGFVREMRKDLSEDPHARDDWRWFFREYLPARLRGR